MKTCTLLAVIGLTVGTVPPAAADVAKFTAKELVDALLTLDPKADDPTSPFDRRRMVCEYDPDGVRRTPLFCFGAVVIDLGSDGVLSAQILVPYDQGRVLQVIVKVPGLRGKVLRDEMASRLGSSCSTEHRHLRDEEGEALGERVMEIWVRQRDPRGVIWIRESTQQGIGVVFATGNPDVREDEFSHCGKK